MNDLTPPGELNGAFDDFAVGIADLLNAARQQAAKSVNAILTATYWEMGRRIVEFEQRGQAKADYGEKVITRLSQELMARFGRGFGKRNLEQMRQFYSTWEIAQTVSAQLPDAKSTTMSAQFDLPVLAQAFPLSWSHYVRLMAVGLPEARRFYETEALRGGWSLRQLERQINTSFYERTALSQNKAALLQKGMQALPSDVMTAAELVKDPYVLEFLGLKDEYSESDLEDALIHHLETFLLEMGTDFTFVARQKRVRVGDDWFRMDLLLFHRRLRCLVIIDIKIGKFDHADAGQMNLYVNYAAEHLTMPDENPPVGIILCSEPNAAVARYALGGLQNEIHAAQYRLLLPDPKQLEAELAETRRRLQNGKP